MGSGDESQTVSKETILSPPPAFLLTQPQHFYDQYLDMNLFNSLTNHNFLFAVRENLVVCRRALVRSVSFFSHVTYKTTLKNNHLWYKPDYGCLGQQLVISFAKVEKLEIFEFDLDRKHWPQKTTVYKYPHLTGMSSFTSDIFRFFISVKPLK